MEQSDLNAAQLFVEVARRRSFTQAAIALGLPKSTLSRKITALESRLGARLLQRTTRQLHLTDVGSAYYERVARIVSDLSEAEAAVSEAQGQPRGVVRVTAPRDLGSTMLAWAMPKFSEMYPEVEVVFELSGRYLDLIAEGIDVAIRAGKRADSTLIARPIFSGTFALYASPEYLNAHGRPTSLDELSSHACVVFGRSPERHWTLSNKSGVAIDTLVRGRVAVEDFDYLRFTTVAGAGIALLPTFLVGPDLHFNRLERILPEYSQPTDTLYVVYPSREFLPAKTRAFIDFVVAQFQEWEKLCISCVKALNPEARAEECPNGPFLREKAAAIESA